MKEIWKQCWREFADWFVGQWKYAWDILKCSIIGLVQACFEWLKTIIGGLFAGLWKLVVKPLGKWLCDSTIDWIQRL